VITADRTLCALVKPVKQSLDETLSLSLFPFRNSGFRLGKDNVNGSLLWNFSCELPKDAVLFTRTNSAILAMPN